jgi:hypothetical protein
MSNSLLGTEQPKIIRDYGLGTEQELIINYSIITRPNYHDIEYIEHKSVLTGQRNFLEKWAHGDFVILVHLWKFGAINDQIDFVDSIKSFAFKDLVFYPHKDKNFVCKDNSTTEPAIFQIVEYYPEPLEVLENEDKTILIIKLKSKDIINLHYNKTITAATTGIRRRTYGVR